MFQKPKYLQNSFTVIFPRKPSIRRSAFDFENKLEDLYSQPQIIGIPDDINPDLPRMIFTSKHGYSQIFISQINFVLNVNYSIDISSYPWYCIVSGADLEQGDILLECPIFDIPTNYLDGIDKASTSIKINFQNLIVMTQSCDLAVRSDGRSKIDYVLLCPIYFKNELKQHGTYSKQSEWENARLGKHLGFHVLNCCDLGEHNYEFMLVDLKRTYSIKAEILRDFVSKKESRVRLLPPYREHLSQSFARFFMRVGLPVDIPKFTK